VQILRNQIDKVLSNILIALMAIMVINVLWQVASRFIIGVPSSFTDELARYIMIWIGILGAAYVSGRNMHVSIDVFAKRMNASNQKSMALIVRLLIIVSCTAIFIIGGSRLVYITHTLDQYSPALQLPLSIVYLVIPISGLLIVFYKVSDIIKSR